MAKSKDAITINDWCRKNNYPGVTKECLISAFSSNNPEVVKLAKREKMKGIIENGKTI